MPAHGGVVAGYRHAVDRPHADTAWTDGHAHASLHPRVNGRYFNKRLVCFKACVASEFVQGGEVCEVFVSASGMVCV